MSIWQPPVLDRPICLSVESKVNVLHLLNVSTRDMSKPEWMDVSGYVFVVVKAGNQRLGQPKINTRFVKFGFWFAVQFLEMSKPLLSNRVTLVYATTNQESTKSPGQNTASDCLPYSFTDPKWQVSTPTYSSFTCFYSKKYISCIHPDMGLETHFPPTSTCKSLIHQSSQLFSSKNCISYF